MPGNKNTTKSTEEQQKNTIAQVLHISWATDILFHYKGIKKHSSKEAPVKKEAKTFSLGIQEKQEHLVNPDVYLTYFLTKF